MQRRSRSSLSDIESPECAKALAYRILEDGESRGHLTVAGHRRDSPFRNEGLGSFRGEWGRAPGSPSGAHPQVREWTLVTPYFEVRNITSSAKCGFHIVEFFNEPPRHLASPAERSRWAGRLHVPFVKRLGR